MPIITSSKSELRKFFLSKRDKVTNKYSNCVSKQIVKYAEEILNSLRPFDDDKTGKISLKIPKRINLKNQLAYYMKIIRSLSRPSNI